MCAKLSTVRHVLVVIVTYILWNSLVLCCLNIMLNIIFYNTSLQQPLSFLLIKHKRSHSLSFLTLPLTQVTIIQYSSSWISVESVISFPSFLSIFSRNLTCIYSLLFELGIMVVWWFYKILQLVLAINDTNIYLNHQFMYCMRWTIHTSGEGKQAFNVT